MQLNFCSHTIIMISSIFKVRRTCNYFRFSMLNNPTHESISTNINWKQMILLTTIVTKINFYIFCF